MPNNNTFWESQESLPEEEQLYSYFLKRLKQDSPAELLKDFRYLFIEGRGFKEGDGYLALEKIVRKRNTEQFSYFLNRCCYILINYWQMNAKFQDAIPQLVSSFQELPANVTSTYNTITRVRQLVKQFANSDQYVKLERIARVINAKEESKIQLISNLIHRYPYLYDHYLVSDNSPYEQQQMVRHIKTNIERHFDVSLSQYVTYKIRLAQVASTPPAILTSPTIRPVSNPTLLSDPQLNKALKQFIGRGERGYTYKGLSQNFLSQLSHTRNFGTFKEELFQYLSSSLDSPYGQSQLTPKLYEYLQNLLPECNSDKLSEFLILRTSSQLLNLLVVNSANNPQHYLFVDMLTNLGVTRTIGLLIKLVLICHKVKPYLEKRFSILFNHYESFSQDGVPWLIKALEYIQVAFSIHFGKVNFSGIQESQIS